MFLSTTIKKFMETKYKRVLLKLSGESLMGEQGHGIDTVRLGQYAAQIAEIVGIDRKSTRLNSSH